MSLVAYERGNRELNKIALTFDDGPNPFWTRKVLDVLDQYNAKGNFFVLGMWAEKYSDIVKETFQRGHLIGNHSYSHPNEGCGDFEKSEKMISEIIGEPTQFIRPPYNIVSLCECYKPAIEGKVRIINNEVIPQDWQLSSEEILQIIKRDTKNGSIILLHDGSHRENEIENRPSEMFKALPKILTLLKEKFIIAKLDGVF
jgi:peptidoglycan-N-acetylglucosamine deacetylase